MKISAIVKKILSNYESDNPGTKANLARILMHGKLGGTGKMVILPVDQGFEHGPDRSFAMNPEAYNPHYHYELAIEAGLNAYAAPLGMIEAGADTFAGQILQTLFIMAEHRHIKPQQLRSKTLCVWVARQSASQFTQVLTRHLICLKKSPTSPKKLKLMV